ncbi:3-oxoacyl-ACP reductase FabG [Streptomyces xanthochromogenes]|uniref:3-oxoacyl-ACP reductase FabG n=1 Tax=Streptomyces xanthochromogenes TaxID=67384 RepID=UPI003446D71E
MSRTVLITGGNRGIGLEIARALAAAGDKVVITHRTGEPPAGLLGVRCDVTDSAAVKAAVDEVQSLHGTIDVLVANAGITRDGLAALTPEDAFTSVLDTNLTGAYRAAKAVIPQMVSARRGRIVFVSSVMGFLGSAGQTNYAASKSGMLGLARSLAWEVGSRGITVNLVTPGLIETEMIDGVSDKRRKQLMDQTPLRRAGTAAEVAAVVRFLASEEASYVTGAAVPVGGGLAMGQ